MKRWMIYGVLITILLIGVVSAWDVQITNPINGSYFGSKPNSFSWSFSGINQSDLQSSFEFNINNDIDGELITTNQVYLAPSKIIQGWNTLNVSVVGYTNQTEYAEITFWVDSISPVLNYVIPSTNLAYTNLDILSFQFNLNELNKGFYWGGSDKYFLWKIKNKYDIEFNQNTLSNVSDTLSEQDIYTLVGGNKYEGNYVWTAYAKDVDPDGTTIREVNLSGTIIRDITNPVLILNGADPITLEALSDSYIEFGATATDNLDPLINSNIIIDSSAVDTNTIGTYIVIYDVQDQAGNSATQITRTVNVVDTTPPIITLVGSDPINIEVFTPYSDSGATALDNYDGDITGNIITVNPVNTNIIGTYLVTYDVMDSSGNPATQITRTVNVVDTTAPIITLVGNTIETIEAGISYMDAGATALDNYDGDITGNIITVNPVDTNTLGTYIVTYDVMDSSGNPATQITRTVNVVDTIVPTISIFIPTNNTFTKDSSQDVNFTVADITLNTCWYSNDTYTANTTLANCNTNITTIAWSEGQHNITIWVNDSANNVNFSQITFTIDRTNPSITLFSVVPTTSISENNPTIISAVDVSDLNLDFTGLMFVDFNNLISSDQILFSANMNDAPVSGAYGPINWPANYFKITDGTTSEPVGIFITDFAPTEYVVTGYLQKDPAIPTPLEDCMLGFNIGTNELTTSYCGNSTINGVSKFTISSLKFTNGIFSQPVETNQSTFTLYDLINPALNPKLESALAPTGNYTAILRTEDLAENENAEIINISVDNTFPFLTSINLSSSVISPINADGYLDDLTITMNANELVDWGTTRIYNSA